MPTCWRRDGSFWLSFLVSWCDFVYEGRGPGGKRQGRDRKQGWEWKWANNHHLHGKCKPGNDSHIYKEIVSIFLYLKGSETKHLSAPGFVLWQKTLFQLSSHKQDYKTRSKAPIAFKRLQDVIMIFWHLAFQRGVFYCDDTNTCMCERWIIVWQVRSAACTRWWSDMRKRRDVCMKFILKERVIFRNNWLNWFSINM